MEKNTVAGGKSVSVLRVLFLAALGLTVASAAAIPFVRFGMNALRDAKAASAYVCFLLADGIFFFGAWFAGAVLWGRFRPRTYLLADGERLDARTGEGKEIHLPFSAITDAEIFMDTLYLYAGQTVYPIEGLYNVREICDFLLERIARRPYIPDTEEAGTAYDRCRRRYFFHTAAVILTGICVVGHTAWGVPGMMGNVPGMFTQYETLIFLAFVLAECLTILLTVFLIFRRSRTRFALQYARLLLTSAEAYLHKYDDLECFYNRLETKYFDRYLYRIVVAERNGEVDENEEEEEERVVYAYLLQQFCLESGSWEICLARGFDTLQELYDDLAVTYGDVMFNE